MMHWVGMYSSQKVNDSKVNETSVIRDSRWGFEFHNWILWYYVPFRDMIKNMKINRVINESVTFK